MLSLSSVIELEPGGEFGLISLNVLPFIWDVRLRNANLRSMIFFSLYGVNQ